MNSLSWVEINTQAIKYNIGQFRKLLPKNYKIAGVIKSNAYGHGMIPMAEFLYKEKLVEYLAVANDLEALELRARGVKLPIIVLSYWDEKNFPELINNNIEIAVYNLEQIKSLRRDAPVGRLKIHLKIDTGMNRLGVKPEEVDDFINKIKNTPYIKLQGLFSHFPVADEDIKFTGRQFLQFKDIVAKIKRRTAVPFVHIANSAGAFFMDETCNLLRLGIAMYGLQPAFAKPSAQNPQFKLQPALSWKTKVIQVKNIKAGERLSYGLTYKFKKDAKIAVLPIGYGDGYDRGLSNCGEVLIRGKRCPVRGRVCMNLTMVEVNESVREGDEAVLIGRQGSEEITADELAGKIGTINYEIVTRINSELEKILKF
ncbi:alanine racemase [Candidatus Falkowbacteria bacterium CG10_big_fil_rev_8_21_14_0_10_43_10]|uniref:Alanine racemase n=1 Tax=Candidatus Falkowbacteria bacterium CG10_big_fil_rev_8_21_14_0_10_43_10 TaxID=1974567 RepID=A0A2H0V449_9BACT|nr:MAG: alanine racemase [Candidatus Falkowbacteria bacterium CG10_big_fil_rev_8_21_14_0_10_43_10]